MDGWMDAIGWMDGWMSYSCLVFCWCHDHHVLLRCGRRRRELRDSIESVNFLRVTGRATQMVPQKGIHAIFCVSLSCVGCLCCLLAFVRTSDVLSDREAIRPTREPPS